VLRNGTHYLAATISLSPRDSFLSFVALPGEAPVVSGGLPVAGLQWERDSTSRLGHSVFRAPFAAWPGVAAAGAAPALRVNGHRATLARYPNRNPEDCVTAPGGCEGNPMWQWNSDGGLDEGMLGTWLPADANASALLPNNSNSTTPANESLVHVFPPEQADPNKGIYSNFTMGYGGNAARYDPPQSMWASTHFAPGYRWDEMHLVSMRGLNYTNGDDGSSLLPNAPYADLAQVVVHTWRGGGWFSWMFGVGRQSSGAPGDRFMFFDRGGHQGGEGTNEGDVWFVEGAREELDDVNEFFHDAAAGQLYFIPNASDASPVDGSPPAEVVVPHLAVLFSLFGAQEFPVRNVSFEGLAFADGRPTFMDQKSVPSGGDWALERQAALLVEGAEDVLVADALFSRIDGNALMLSGYTRGVVVRDSEFALLGGSAVALWGRAVDGYDITGGQQPRGTVVERCFFHDLGLIQKQSSGVFQGLAPRNAFRNLIFFNVPRAAVNFNDGAGGGSELAFSLLFNTCRESGDHGLFSWRHLENEK
jgi:hypothetical protein